MDGFRGMSEGVSVVLGSHWHFCSFFNMYWCRGPVESVWVAFGFIRYLWSFYNNYLLVRESGRGCLGGL